MGGAIGMGHAQRMRTKKEFVKKNHQNGFLDLS